MGRCPGPADGLDGVDADDRAGYVESLPGRSVHLGGAAGYDGADRLGGIVSAPPMADPREVRA